VRFLVLMADDGTWERADRLEREATLAAHIAFAQAVDERATMVAGEALAGPEEARTLRPGSGGDRPVTTGPVAETAEWLGGFYLIDADSRDLVIELCRLLPAEYAVEVRPTIEVDPDLG
jgi:hypothetical protein